jgi:pimeloyl-ACP methyl ester carboxylesterase
MMNQGTGIDLAAWIADDMASAPPEVAISAIRNYMAMWVSGEGPAVFEELPLPVVAVCADMWPIDAAANRRHMQSFEGIVLEGTDHFLMLGAAERFNQALEEAMEKLES